MNPQIKPLSKDLKEDYLHYFDTMRFEEHPEWAKCYCYDYHFLGDVETCTREDNRAAVTELIENDRLRGYLVYENDRPIGWCNSNNRSNYQRLLRDYDFVDDPTDKVRSIVCFLIHPDYRRQGLARLLLERIIQDSAATEFDYLEAYPKKEERSCAGNFKGPLELYQQHGFRVHKEYDTYLVMRRAIG